MNPDAVYQQPSAIFEAQEKTKTLSLDADMKHILERSDITDEEKVKLYEEALSRYTVFRRKSMQTPTTSPKTDESLMHFVDDIVTSAPKPLKGKAEQLARTVLKGLKWSPRGELIVNDLPMSGTHVIDLVNDAIRSRKSFNPRGRQQFVEAMSNINVPQNLIGNQNVWQALQAFNRMGEIPKHVVSPKRPRERQDDEDEDIEETPMRIPLIDRERRRGQFDPSNVKRWLQYHR